MNETYKQIGEELLQKCKAEFEKRKAKDEALKELYELVKDDKATYKQVEGYAHRIGELLVSVLNENIEPGMLPDGRMYYEIADVLLFPLLASNHNSIVEACRIVQKNINQHSGIGLKPKDPDLNRDYIHGITVDVSSYEKFEDGRQAIQEPVINFGQKVADDAVRVNAEFQYRSGRSPIIVRTNVGGCCERCAKLAGVYDYDKHRGRNDPIYQRHNRCRCTVEFFPGSNRKQNVHTKRWSKF